MSEWMEKAAWCAARLSPADAAAVSSAIASRTRERSGSRTEAPISNPPIGAFAARPVTYRHKAELGRTVRGAGTFRTPFCANSALGTLLRSPDQLDVRRLDRVQLHRAALGLVQEELLEMAA